MLHINHNALGVVGRKRCTGVPRWLFEVETYDVNLEENRFLHTPMPLARSSLPATRVTSGMLTPDTSPAWTDAALRTNAQQKAAFAEKPVTFVIDSCLWKS